MAKRKIDPVVLQRMVRAGKTGKQIAEHFKVSEGAVSIAKRNVNVSVARVASLEHANEIVYQNFNLMHQLNKVNQHSNELMDLLLAACGGDKKALKALKSHAVTHTTKLKDPKEILLKVFAEVREQISLQMNMMASLYDSRAVAEFQREILDTIGEVDPNVKKAIITKLNQKKSLRRSFE